MSGHPKDSESEIKELLANYELGERVFIDAEDWDYPLAIKPNSQNKDIPTNWLALAETVIGIIARNKYGIQAYPNVIQIIDAEQMLNAYSSIGMPVTYTHWSFGKDLINNEKAYQQGNMGLAYEIVINSDPTIAYCMAQNTKMMQMLVIAHASFGHNSFFRNNHLFKQFTNAREIIPLLTRLQDFVKECEDLHGVKEVEAILDVAHALSNHGVDRYTKPNKRTPQEESERRQRLRDEYNRKFDPVMDGTVSPSVTTKFKSSTKPQYESLEGEENLLSLLSSLAPHLEDWQRKLIRMIGERAQYFYPQGQTQLMNEGWATFWHHTLLNDLYDMNLVSDGMMFEFLSSHTSVIRQPGFDSAAFSGKFNPYALGFAMYQDIKRICLNPTEEDIEWFPEFAGNQDWVSVLKSAAENYRDESFVLQYLSPKLMRDFGMFSICDDDKTRNIVVDAIHDKEGYKAIRTNLATNYRYSDLLPRVEATKYFYTKDRTLVLEHTIHNRRPLEESDLEQMLRYVYAIWRHPVVLQTMSPEGEILKTYGCPKVPKCVDKGNVYREVTLG